MGRSQIIRRRESLVIYNPVTTPCSMATDNTERFTQRAPTLHGGTHAFKDNYIKCMHSYITFLYVVAEIGEIFEMRNDAKCGSFMYNGCIV